MTPSTLGMVVLLGMLAGAGVVAVVAGLRPAQPRLGDALAHLEGHAPAGLASPGPMDSRSERMGFWFYKNSPIPLWDSQRRVLELRRRSVAEFYAEKVIFAVLAAAVPSIVGVSYALMSGGGLMIPAVVSLVAAPIGFFIPDLLLRRQDERARTDAAEALSTFFDLVTLERLANLSATQSLTAAAALSDSPLFVSIRQALHRARLEQQPPFHELKKLAVRLRLPELGDIADVMQLDEYGAALSSSLRARVKELRDEHLSRAKVQAHAVSERMTVFMAVPAMVFGLIFLVPPLLRLVQT